MFYYSVVNLLRVVIHYSKYHSNSAQNVVIQYIFGSESLRVVNSLQMANSLRVLFDIYIYIYGCGAICRRKFCHFYHSIPNSIVKNGQKEMLQICPVSVRSRSIEITPNWLETAVPSPVWGYPNRRSHRAIQATKFLNHDDLYRDLEHSWFRGPKTH